MILIVMTLLLIKHFIADFPLQTQEQINNKGKYGNLTGFSHSLQHGMLTAAALWYFTPWALLLAAIDTFTHYHIDWVKMRFGCQDISNKKFWIHLGFDQLMHGLNYIGLIALCLWLK